MKLQPRRGAAANFLGLEFDDMEKRGTVRDVLSLSEADAFSYVVTPNVDHLVRLHGRTADDALWTSYRGATLCLCDSRILRALASLSGIHLPLNPGSDLTAGILLYPTGVENALVVGGDARLISGLRARYPHITWAHLEPPQGLLADPAARREVVDFVEVSSARLTFLAVGSPQSELICAALAERDRAKGVALCIGASLEFLTGIKRRAPGWMQVMGLEWLFRLVTEPKRLCVAIY